MKVEVDVLGSGVPNKPTVSVDVKPATLQPHGKPKVTLVLTA